MADTGAERTSTATTKKRKNKRRRNKRDLVLDFSKKGDDGQAEAVAIKDFYKNEKSKKGGNRGKISLKTSSKDYDGALGLPEQVTQREFETTGQFFRRLDRLLAKAKVEANLESRFDMTLPRDPKMQDQ